MMSALSTINVRPKHTCLPYDLRNGKTFIIRPSSKSAEEHKNLIKCPPLKLQEKKLEYVKGLGAKPLGSKGYLSKSYNKDCKLKYINQFFCQRDKIGEGSYGVVHAYQSIEDNTMYAIKILPKHYVKDEVNNLDVVTDILNCIQYVNAWEEDGLAYIQLELGIMSLADYAEKNHNIMEEECWNILHDVTQALLSLHNKGYCHMDVKPENIIITAGGLYKLCDFGLLFKTSTKNLQSFSEGDAKYIASEVLQGCVSPAGDIFSLGISIMEIAMDWLLPTHGDLWHEIRGCDWRTSPKDEKRRISIEMEQLLNWMMCSDPEQRPSAHQLLVSPSIRERLRSRKARFNYFEAWHQQYLTKQPKEFVPKLVLNHDSSLNLSAVESDAESDNMKTPPRRISSILICQRIHQ